MACQTITTNSTLAADIVATMTPCIVFGADGIVLFLNDHTIDMRAFPSGVAIQSISHAQVRIEGPGTVLTASPEPTMLAGAGVAVSGGSVRIRDVSLRNARLIGGQGISISGVSGAQLLDNQAQGDSIGIAVFESTAPAGGADLISHNTVQGNVTWPVPGHLKQLDSHPQYGYG